MSKITKRICLADLGHGCALPDSGKSSNHISLRFNSALPRNLCIDWREKGAGYGTRQICAKHMGKEQKTLFLLQSLMMIVVPENGLTTIPPLSVRFRCIDWQ